MVPELQAKCEAFARHSVPAPDGTVAALPFEIPFLDDAIATVVKALDVAGVAMDKIVQWVPEIALTIVTTAKSIQEVIAEIKAKIQAAG